MGFEVHVVVVVRKPPNEAVMTALDHQFGAASHEAGSKTVTITEHVSVSSEEDAIGFVRSLVLDAVPQGSTISAVTATPA